MSEVWSNWVKRIEVVGIRIQKTNRWIWAQVEIKHASGASCHLGKVIKNLKIYKESVPYNYPVDDSLLLLMSIESEILRAKAKKWVLINRNV